MLNKNKSEKSFLQNMRDQNQSLQKLFIINLINHVHNSLMNHSEAYIVPNVLSFIVTTYLFL